MSELDGRVSVEVRIDVLEARHRGGVEGYRRSVPNATYRSDGVVTRVSFADVESAGWWVRVLRMKGLRDGDITVAAAQPGLTPARARRRRPSPPSATRRPAW